MIFAVIENNEKEQLCCVDRIGARAFLLRDFFESDLKELCIGSNQIDQIPETIDDLIEHYNVEWTDDMALFFGGNPGLGITLDPENGWHPLVKLEELWSPLEEERGLGLLK